MFQSWSKFLFWFFNPYLKDPEMIPAQKISFTDYNINKHGLLIQAEHVTRTAASGVIGSSLVHDTGATNGLEKLLQPPSPLRQTSKQLKYVPVL